MKKSHFFFLNLIAVLLLSACGGSNHDPLGPTIPQKDIPPLHTGDKIISTGEVDEVPLNLN